jgi:LmbE family N-acetylglucosaminyl deacetylase
MELTQLRTAVLSPHLDDGALSLGATLAGWSRAGADVSVVTVLAGNPDSQAPARLWDRQSGFTTAGEASRGRRKEDRVACAILGARPVWLPFGDALDEPGVDDETIWATIAEAVAGVDVLLLPGFPLLHSEHDWLTRLVLEREPLAAKVGLYVEQPYAHAEVVGWRLSARNVARLASIAVGTPWGRRRQTPRLPDAIADLVPHEPAWAPLPADARARRAKRRALAAYRTQVPRLGRWVPIRIGAYERGFGGEGVAWLDLSFGRTTPMKVESAHGSAEIRRAQETTERMRTVPGRLSMEEGKRAWR